MPSPSPYARISLSRELQPIGEPAPGTPESEAARQRFERATNPSSMYWVPQGPDEWAHSIWERVDESERRIAAPNRQLADYENGTAQFDNDVAEVGQSGGMLFSAEHATRTFRFSKATGQFERSLADFGTAGMAAVLAEDHGHGFILRGRQTVPLAIEPYILSALSDHDGFISVHGCAGGLFVGENDPTGIHAHLGLGSDPTEAERDYAEQAVRYGREELGLHVVIGNDQRYYVQTGPEGNLMRKKDGTLYTNQLAARSPYTTTSVVRRALSEQGRSDTRALQVEMAPLLLPTALDGSWPKDKKAEVIGVALGYKLLSKMVELAHADS